MTTPIQVMLIEDNPEYRAVIELALKKDPAINLQSQYGTAEFALGHLKEASAQPDVILLDLNLPQMSGLEAIPLFTEASPVSKIIILTQSDKQGDVLSAIQQGAAGYLLKSSTVQQVKEGIRTVMEGGASLDWKVAHFILDQMQHQPRKLSLEKPLSSRELEILTLLSEGLVKKEIGDQLDISYGSVATYIRRIYEKLNVPNAPAAITKAYKTGLLSPEE